MIFNFYHVLVFFEDLKLELKTSPFREGYIFREGYTIAVIRWPA